MDLSAATLSSSSPAFGGDEQLSTRAGFAAALTSLKKASPHSYTRLARLTGIPVSTVHGWCQGLHVPYPRQRARFVDLLTVLGVDNPSPWLDALIRLRDEEQLDATDGYPGSDQHLHLVGATPSADRPLPVEAIELIERLRELGIVVDVRPASG